MSLWNIYLVIFLPQIKSEYLYKGYIKKMQIISTSSFFFFLIIT